MTAVDVELLLHPAGRAVRRDVLAQRRALERDALPERRPDRAVQPRELLRVELACRAAWMHAGAPERLVGVDVPDPGDAPLVEQERLDRRASALRRAARASPR